MFLNLQQAPSFESRSTSRLSIRSSLKERSLSTTPAPRFQVPEPTYIIANGSLFHEQEEEDHDKSDAPLLPKTSTESKDFPFDPLKNLPLPLYIEKMCTLKSGYCRYHELTGQYGLTKQLVLKLALPHVTLLIVSFIYAVIGTFILASINFYDKTPESVADDIISSKSNFSAALISFKYLPPSHHHIRRHHYSKNFDEFSKNLYQIYLKYPKSRTISHKIKGYTYFEDKDLMHNITFSLYYVTTTLTSIGYGVNPPDSFIGRCFCMFYIMLGIPLYLITLADLAKFCTEGMNRSYTEILKFKFEVIRKLKKWKRYGIIKRRESIKVDEIIIAGGDDEVAEFLWTHLENAHFVEVPFLLIYVILLSYIGVASYIIAYLEGWTLLDGFYFIMISVLTIGFGDIVPRNPHFIIIILLIILFGIVLTTTCIDIVGAYYIDQLHFFGRRLDEENPLEWLKEVQMKRIQAMKMDAMRKLFETVTALHRMQFGGLKYDPSKLNQDTDNDKSAPIKLPDAPFSPKNIIAFNATSDSVCLKWEPPIYVDEGRRFWYTLTYKTRTPQFRSNITIVDFITSESYKVTGLKSFTLYEFSVVTTTRYGSSKPVKCQEYTEPCTVPQLLNLEAISSETATISWQAPQKNNGQERYVVLYAQEPAPQFVYWRRYKVGSAKKFTITDLRPDTMYIVCVSAEHNFGLAAMSKSIRFKTRRWWFEEELILPFTNLLRISNSMHKLSSASSESNCLR